MTKRAKPREFYVYMYLRTRSSEYGAKGSPYYIGKGSRNRRFDSCHRVKPPKDPGCNILVAYGLTESEAHQEEIRLIGEYGRIDLGTGCLRNQTHCQSIKNTHQKLGNRTLLPTYLKKEHLGGI